VNATIRGGRYTPSTTGQTSVYGTHWQDAWSSTTAGRIVIACNEPTADTSDQCSFTLAAASGSGFTSAGNVSMKTLTDVVTWEMPYYALGITGFAASAPTITGTNAGNHTFDFQYDLNDGAGYNGTWLTLNSTNLSAITVDPADGVKLKVRATVNTANSGNLLTYISIATVTNSVAQQTEYPLPVVLNTAQVTNILTGSRIRVYNTTTATEIANEIVAGTSWTLLYVEGAGFTSGDVLNIRLTRCDGATASLDFQATAIAGASGWSLFAAQINDTVYATNAIDGSAVTEFTLDYPNVQVDIDDPDGTSTITRLYAWFVNELTTEQGIRTLVGGLFAEDVANYRINAATLNLKLDNVAATGVQFVGDLRLYRDDGASPVVATTTGGGSIVLFAGKVYTVEGGGGGGGGGATALEIWTYSSRTLTANPGPTAAATASAVRTELATELARVDVATSTRLATAGYTAPDNASVAAILVDTGTTLPAQIAAIPTTPLLTGDARLDRLDVAISTRLATAGYTAPLNSTATQAAAAAALTAYDAATAADLSGLATAAAVAAIPTTPLLAADARLNALDVAISTRLAAADYDAPLDATATQAAAAAALTAAEPLDANVTQVAGVAVSGVADFRADLTGVLAAIAALPDDVRSELAPELAQLDAAISTRQSEATALTRATTINDGVKQASLLIPHTGSIT
jgi:hypothetical protein